MTSEQRAAQFCTHVIAVAEASETTCKCITTVKINYQA